jgi:hypothetical protein
MPGWDVKIRPAKEEDKKKDDDYTWVIVIVILVVLWLILGGGLRGLHTTNSGFGCGGVHQTGYRCDRVSAPYNRHRAPGSGHQREDPGGGDDGRP